MRGDAPAEFDAILCAGNVMTFLHPATRVPALTAMASLLAPDGRAVVGFGRGRGYEFDEFVADAAAAGLALASRFATWDLRPFASDADFQVAFLTR